MPDTNETIDISSTITHDGKPLCLLEWNRQSRTVDPDVVLNTARELAAAAARAETDVALLNFLRHDVDVPMHTAAGLLEDMRLARPPQRGKTALRIEAIAGARTGLPYVHIHRGSMSGSISPDEARQMAQHWTEVAVAAHVDARIRHVLGDYQQLTIVDVEDIFKKVAALGARHQERERG